MRTWSAGKRGSRRDNIVVWERLKRKRLTTNGKETPYLELVTATGNLRYTFHVPRKVK